MIRSSPGRPRGSKSRKRCSTLAYWDSQIDKIRAARRQTVAATASGRFLTAIGFSKGIKRLPGEKDEQYRPRVPRSKKFRRPLGTVKGLLDWLKAAGHPAKIVEYSAEFGDLKSGYPLDGSWLPDGSEKPDLGGRDPYRIYNWAAFDVAVDHSAAAFDQNAQKYVAALVNLVRPSGRIFKKLVYFHSFVWAADANFRFELTISVAVSLRAATPGLSGRRILDGTTRPVGPLDRFEG